MSTFALLLTGLALAMDAFAVCISSSMAHPSIPWRRMLRLPLVFALFQAGMPALGFAGALAFRGLIEAYDHWIAFTLLVAIGVHMLHEARDVGADGRIRRDPLRLPVLIGLAVATSIDALAAGVGLAVLDVPILTACVSIGARLAHHAEILGGALLIGLGVKILVEHLSA